MMEQTITALCGFYRKRETVELAWIFEKYMKDIGAKKLDKRRKDCSHTYLIDGKSTNWNRVECYYHKENDSRYGKENLSITLRKRSGSYFLIERKLRRAFEISEDEVICLDKELLNEIVEEHKALFEMLCHGF